MSFAIVCTCKEFGKGYFIGFQKGHSYFQSCFDKYAKTYKTRVGAEKQLARIIVEPCMDSELIEIIEI